MDEWARPPPPVQTKDSKDPDSRVEAASEASGDSSDLSQSGHAFARASERLKSVGYRHREGEPKDEEDPQATVEETTDDTIADSEGELSATEKEQVRNSRRATPGCEPTKWRTRQQQAHSPRRPLLRPSTRSGWSKLCRWRRSSDPATGNDRLQEAIKDAQQAERAALHRRIHLQTTMPQPQHFAREHSKHVQSFQTRSASPPPRAQKSGCSD